MRTLIAVWLCTGAISLQGNPLTNCRGAHSAIAGVAVHAPAGSAAETHLNSVVQAFRDASAGNPLPVDGLVALFKNPASFGEAPVIHIVGPGSNFYEFLVPLVNPKAKVIASESGPGWEIMSRFMRGEKYWSSMFEHVQRNNPTLLTELKATSWQELRALVRKRVRFVEDFETAREPADLLLVHSPQGVGLALEDAVRPGGLMWVTSEDHDMRLPDRILRYPRADLGGSLARVAGFGQRSTGGQYLRLEDGPGFTGAFDYGGTSRIYLRPIVPQSTSSPISTSE